MANGVAGTSGQYLRITTNLPSTAVFSICGWAVRRSGTNSGFPTLVGLESGATSAASWVNIEMFASNTMGISDAAGSTNFASTVATGTPFFFALTNNGSGASNLNGYWKSLGGSSMTTVSRSGSAFTPGALYILSDSYDEPFDGYVGPVKMWTTALTQSQLEVEMYRALPAFTTNLYGFWPLWNTGDLSDYSGNGHTLTSAGTHAQEANGPVVWGAGQNHVSKQASSASAASSSPTITVDATSAALKQADGSSSPTLTFAAAGASLFAAAASSSPTLTFAATGADLTKADGSSSPTLTVDATSAALKAAAGSSSPTLTIDATSAALKQSAASSAPSITADAGGASLFTAAASSAPSITVDATGQSSTGGSDPASAPSITVDATSRVLFAGAGSSAPTLTIDAISAALKAVTAACSPTLTFDATSASLFAAAGSSAPTITVNATSQITSDASSAPTITGAATGASLAAAAGDSSPTLTFNATSAALKAAAASCAPIIIVNATSGGAGSSSLWRPFYGVGSQIWRPDWYPGYL